MKLAVLSRWRLSEPVVRSSMATFYPARAGQGKGEVAVAFCAVGLLARSDLSRGRTRAVVSEGVRLDAASLAVAPGELGRESGPRVSCYARRPLPRLPR